MITRTLFDTLRASYARLPDKPAILADGESYNYRSLYESSMKLAAAFAAAGVERGDRVVLYMENTWACAVAIYAVQCAGAAFVVVNPQTKADKLHFILENSGAKAFITESSLEKFFSGVIEQLPGLACFVAGEVSVENARSLDEVFARPIDPSYLPAPTIASDLAALIYTSGSTGSPKGVMHNHHSMVFTLGSLVEYLRLKEDDRILCVLPLAFDYGLYQLLMSVYLGATLVLERSFVYPAEVYNRVRDEKVTVFPAVPTMFSMLITSSHKQELVFPDVRTVTNTAAALPASFNTSLQRIFPNANLFRMYGLTECKRVSYLEPELVGEKPMSVGKAIPGTEVFLLSEDGKPVAPGEEGVLYVRGPHVMLGYWENPEKTAEMIVPGRYQGDRWLCTHDYFFQDEDGCLYFAGRKDDMIKSRGEKVSPVEVENALHAIDGVKDVAVVGIPDPVLGHMIRAYVSPKPGAELNPRKIKHECLGLLESFMVPQEILVMDTLPKSANGKIDKKVLLAESVKAPEPVLSVVAGEAGRPS